MPQTQPAASAVAPLLIELARSLRALQYLGAGHPTLAQALVRTAAVWSTGLRSLGALELEVLDAGFAVGGTEPSWKPPDSSRPFPVLASWLSPTGSIPSL